MTAISVGEGRSQGQCAGVVLPAGRIPVEIVLRDGWGLMGSGCGQPQYQWQWRKSGGSSGYKTQQTWPDHLSVRGYYTLQNFKMSLKKHLMKQVPAQ